jgi:hypothetical protein
MLKKIYKLILIIFVIICIIFFGYSFRALRDFYQYKNTVYLDIKLTFNSFKFFLENNIIEDRNKLVLPKPSKDSLLKTIYLEVDQKKLRQLNLDLPKSGLDKFVNAKMRINDKKYVIKLRYRGDNDWHWAFKQKSFRIKLSDTDNINGEQKFNLIAPQATYLRDKITYGIYKKLGLITLDYYPVRVFLNGDYQGVYIHTSQVDESLLRNNKRMPGSVYSGDKSAPNNSDNVNLLWFDSKYWDKVASRNAQEVENRDDINLLINAINNFDDVSFFNFANTFLNKDQIYKYFAVDVIFGSDHHDFWHNHKIYFDPYLGKFELVPWDVVNWNNLLEKDNSLYLLINRIKLNPILEYERDKASYDLLNSKYFDIVNLINEANEYQNIIMSDKIANPYRCKLEAVDGIFFKDYDINKPIPGCKNYITVDTNNELEAYKYNLTARQNNLKNVIYSDASTTFNFYKLANNKFILNFKVLGNSPIKFNFQDLVNSKIYKNNNFNNILDNEDNYIDYQFLDKQILYPGRKKRPFIFENKSYIQMKGDYEIINAPLYYSYIIDGSVDFDKNSLLKATNAITRQVLDIKYEDFEINNDESDSIHPWLLPNYEEKSIILSGNIEVKEDLIFDEHSQVNILAGTTFVIYPDKSIFIYGNLNAIGTKENPIKFISKDKQKPWGTFVLQGEKADGSKMDFVEFDGGSVANRNLIYYSGQFNIHDVDDFEVFNCKVSKNTVGDDNMHIAYGKGVIDGCIFYNSNSDALDIDIADVTVKNSIFINSGNDLLDLMTSEAHVQNNIFINGGDKCVSTGEATNGGYFGNIFYSCNIGIQIKEDSRVNFGDNLIMNSKKVAIDLYRKNFMYEKGGTLYADIIYVINNLDDITFDSYSFASFKEIKKTYPNIEKFSELNRILNLDNNWINLDKAIKNLQTIYVN